jgi:hypothetical protein
MRIAMRFRYGQTRRTWLGLGAVLITLARCSLNPQADLPVSAPSDRGANGNGAGATGSVLDGGVAFVPAGDASLPPEQRNAIYEAPVVTGRLLWSANSQTGKVAVMDAGTLVIKTFDAGYSPKYLAAVPTSGDASSAIVLNTGSHDATWFRLPQGLAGDPLRSEFIPIRDYANTWAVSKSGRWAIAWADARLVTGGSATDQYQNATVIDLSDAAAGNRTARLGSLGYRPSSISFDTGETYALVVDQSPNGGPGISVIDLTQAPPKIRQLDLAPGQLGSGTFDVVVTPDGKSALFRREGNSQVGVVDIATGKITTLELGGNVTDLDLSEDGNVAVAVLRDLSQVVSIDMRVPTAASPPSVTIAGEIFGSAALSTDGSRAALYTTAVPNYDHVTLLSLGDSPTWRTVALKAPVSSMFVARGAQHAVAVLSVNPSSTVKGAFSLIPIESQLSPKIVATPDAPPTAVAIAPDGDRVLVTVRNDASQKYGVYLASLPSLEVNLLELASPPTATGVVPSVRKGYVAQAHPEGRITVIDLDTGNAQTVTGFELAAKVRYTN